MDQAAGSATVQGKRRFLSLPVRPEHHPPLTPIKAAEAFWAGFLLFGVTGIATVYGTRYAFLYAPITFVFVLVIVPAAIWGAVHYMARRASFAVGWLAGLILSVVFAGGAPFYGNADKFVERAYMGPAINYTLVAVSLGVLLALAGGFDMLRKKKRPATHPEPADPAGERS